jgi:Tol biopolymer transport system component
MKTMLIVTVAVLASAILIQGALPQSGYDLYQQALLKEKTEGSLEEAIALYKRILKEHGQDRILTARTLVQLGKSYERLGNAEARAVYERLLREYADQKAPAAEAQLRLAALAKREDAGATQEVADVPPPNYIKLAETSGWFAFADYSPNGKWIVFETFEGEGHPFWIARRGSMEKRIIMKGAGDCSQVRWAPTGEFISCAKSRFDDDIEPGFLLFRANQDTGAVGGEPQVIRTRLPVHSYDWHPDGKRIFFISTRPALQQAVLSLLDIENHQMTEVSTGNVATMPHWSKDGRSIYLMARNSTSGPGIVRFDMESKQMQPALSNEFIVDVSPQDLLLTITQIRQSPRVQFLIRSLATGRFARLNWRDDVELNTLNRGRISQQGDRVAVPTWTSSSVLRKVDLKDGSISLVSKDRGYFGQPVISPYGSRVFYQEMQPTSSILHTRNTTDGAEDLQPQQEYMSRPSISPDGRLIAYKGAKGLGIYDIEARRARLLVLESEIAWTRITWSRDSQAISYLAKDKNEWGIVVARLDGSRKRIAAGGQDLTCADWLPDGKRLIYARRNAGKYEVVVKPLDDSAGSVLLTTDLVISNPAVSPDGKWLSVWGQEQGKREGRVYIASTSGASLRVLGPKEPRMAESDFVFWLADSKRLAALIYTADAMATDIHVFNIETLEDRIVTMGDNTLKTEFAISKDGSVAYYDAYTFTDGVLWEIDISEAVKRVTEKSKLP